MFEVFSKKIKKVLDRPGKTRYNKIRKQRERRDNMRYIVKKFDTLKGWIYYNSFKTYSEAVEELERLQRQMKKAKFEITTED